ncbi:MAG: hypothetical protein KGL39_16670 [Patescibacteria group bacterium]|nr:hypothetical protein [Patescibacteria group bacterium]
MAEPTSSIAVASLAATLSSITMQLLGVPGLAVVWGFVGAMMTMSQMQAMPWPRAVLFGLLSTLSGAAIGAGSVGLMGVSGNPALILGSLAGGAGAFGIVGSLAQRLAKSAGGSQ